MCIFIGFYFMWKSLHYQCCKNLLVSFDTLMNYFHFCKVTRQCVNLAMPSELHWVLTYCRAVNDNMRLTQLQCLIHIYTVLIFFLIMIGMWERERDSITLLLSHVVRFVSFVLKWKLLRLQLQYTTNFQCYSLMICEAASVETNV